MKTALLAALLTLSLSPAAFAKEPSKEQREKMAKNHEKLAECLRSDKPMKECHDEMREQCKDEDCPMMHDMMGKKMRHAKMKGPEQAAPSKTE